MEDALTIKDILSAKEALKQPINISDDPHRIEYYEFLKKGPEQDNNLRESKE